MCQASPLLMMFILLVTFASRGQAECPFQS